MFKVRCIVRRFTGDLEVGQKKFGDVWETTRDRAFYLAGLGQIEIQEGNDSTCDFETKHEPRSLSRAVHPLELSTSNPLEDGPSSPSTTRGDSPLTPKSSTAATTAGGKSTPKAPAKGSRASAGVRTAKRAAILSFDTSLSNSERDFPVSQGSSIPAVASGIRGRKPST